MRIALVHYSFLPVVGGVETVMAEHARLFARAGHSVTIIAGSDSQGVEFTQGVHFARIPEIAHSQADVDSLVRVMKPICEMQDIVIVHNVCTMPFHPGLTEALWELATELTRVRFLCWIHDLAACNPDYALDDLKPDFRKRLVSAHERLEYVTISPLRQRQFRELTGRDSRLIPNGIDLCRFLNLEGNLARFVQEHRILDRDVVLLHPARLLRRKNVELSIRVAAAIRTKGRSIALLITGPPDIQNAASREYEASVRALRRELQVEAEVILLHELFAVTTEDLIRLFDVADALFFPSRQEGFGLPILEAALHRLPVFCADLEPMNALLTQPLHLFRPDAAPAEIADQVIGTSEALTSVQARKETVRRYSWDVIDREHLIPLLKEPPLSQSL